MKSLGKRMRDESGKHPVNKDDEENVAGSRATTGVRQDIVRGAGSRAQHPPRHCEERLRRSNPSIRYAALWIASRSLSSGARSRDPVARNDEVRLRLPTTKNENARDKPGHDAVSINCQR